jgi:hypothetical protein
MPGTNLVIVEHFARRVARGVGPRTGVFLLAGLAISGWAGFLLLAGVLLATKPNGGRPEPEGRPTTPVAIAEQALRQASLQPVSVPQPMSLPPTILTIYEERRRIQEWLRQWDAADHEDGNVAAARHVYEHAARKGWAPAALALALTYDPFELKRRGVAIAPDPGKARACYLRARELMNATVAYYLSRLPPGTGEEKC